MGYVVPGVDLLVAAIAAATILVLADVAVLAPSRPLKRAWWGLSVMLGGCVLLLLVHAACTLGHRPGMGDLVGVAIFQLGVCFIYGIAWLSRRTARDMLRVQDMARDAYRDPLTGIGNRRRFTESLEGAIGQARLLNQPVSVIAIDIDHFKVVNDTHGHAAGDEVLKRVAGEIGARLRAADVACRVGGEEFAVILRDMDPVAAAALAERLRHGVAAARVPLEGGPALRVTISLGLAALVDGEGGPALVRRADDALYLAKGGGRDRLHVAA